MAIWIVLPILTLLMFDLGLTLKFEDFGKVFRSPWPIAIALVGQLILLPLIALFTIPFIMSLVTTMVGQSVGITLPVGNLIAAHWLLSQ